MQLEGFRGQKGRQSGGLRASRLPFQSVAESGLGSFDVGTRLALTFVHYSWDQIEEILLEPSPHRLQ